MINVAKIDIFYKNFSQVPELELNQELKSQPGTISEKRWGKWALRPMARAQAHCSCITARTILTDLTRTSAQTKRGCRIDKALGLLLVFQLLNYFLSTLNPMIYVLLCDAVDENLQATFLLPAGFCNITLIEDNRGRLEIRKEGHGLTPYSFACCFCQQLAPQQHRLAIAAGFKSSLFPSFQSQPHHTPFRSLDSTHWLRIRTADLYKQSPWCRCSATRGANRNIFC